jgi:hypothetical protein
VLLRMGKQQDAIHCFQGALKLFPNAATTRSSLNLASSCTTSKVRTLQLLPEEWEQLHGLPLRKFIKGRANLADPERKLRSRPCKTSTRARWYCWKNTFKHFLA